MTFGIAIAMCSVLAASASAQDPRSADLRLSAKAQSVLGEKRFGCVVPRVASGKQTGWDLVVTDRTAKTRRLARQTVRESGVSEPVVIAHAAPRYRSSVATRLAGQLLNQAASRVGVASVGLRVWPNSKLNPCPRVVITLRHDPPPADLEWARQQSTKYGTARVVATVAAPGASVPL